MAQNNNVGFTIESLKYLAKNLETPLPDDFDLQVAEMEKRWQAKDKYDYYKASNLKNICYFARRHGIRIIDEENKPNPYAIADAFLKDFIFKTTEADEEIYYYDGGIYHTTGEQKIKTETKNLVFDMTMHQINEIIGTIKAKTYVPKNRFTNEPHLIHLQNGIFNLKTGELNSFDPEIMSLNKLPFKYDKDADCPNIKKFLSEVIKETDTPLLQEFVGYCLQRDYRFHKILMLVGDGGNGKSTFCNLIKEFLGRENVAAISLQELHTNKFAPARLLGKLANIYPDLPPKTLTQTALFKALTGEDTITVEQKFKNAFELQSYAKMIFSANALPIVYDESDAFYRRLLIINFPNQFLGKKSDPQLLSKLTTKDELSGFFNWVCEGLKRLNENGKFAETKTIDEWKDLYQRLSNPVLAFAKDCIEFDKDAWTEKDEIYRSYVSYCKDENLLTKSKEVVAKELLRNYPEIAQERRGGKGNQSYGWKGIRLVVKVVGQKSAPLSNWKKDIDINRGNYPTTLTTNIKIVRVGENGYEENSEITQKTPTTPTTPPSVVRVENSTLTTKPLLNYPNYQNIYNLIIEILNKNSIDFIGLVNAIKTATNSTVEDLGLLVAEVVLKMKEKGEIYEKPDKKLELVK